MFIGAIAETDYDADYRVGVGVYDMGGDISTVDLSVTRNHGRIEVMSAALSPAEARELAGWLLVGADRCDAVRARPA